MSSNQQEWAKRVIAAFEDADLMTNEEVAAAGGPSTTTVSKYRGLAEGRIDEIAEPRADVYRKIDKVARWEPSGARRLWRYGEEPVPAGPELVRLYLADPDAEPMAPRTRARLLNIVERKVFELMQEAMTKAAEVAEGDPAQAERIIDEAMTVAEMLRMTAGLAADGAPRMSEPSDTTDDLLAAHDEETPISAEQEGESRHDN